MLLNGVHLLPDLSGALICPKDRLLAVSDPIGDPAARTAPQAAAETLKRLAALLRQRRPAQVVWLGGALPALWADGALSRRDADDLQRLVQAQPWHWVADTLPAGLPGHGGAVLTAAGLTFRHGGLSGSAALGEVSAQPWPVAGMDGQVWPCFVIDGRRLILPAFGGGRDGVNVLSPAILAMFRRPFQALLLAGNRIVTRPRARLEPPPSPTLPAVK